MRVEGADRRLLSLCRERFDGGARVKAAAHPLPSFTEYRPVRRRLVSKSVSPFKYE